MQSYPSYRHVIETKGIAPVYHSRVSSILEDSILESTPFPRENEYLFEGVLNLGTPKIQVELSE